MITWHPSGRRSTETGEVADVAFEHGNVVPYAQPEVYSEPPDQRKDTAPDTAALEVADEMLGVTLRLIYEVLRDGPPRKAAARIAGVFRHLEIEKRGLRELAEELGISLGSMSETAAEMRDSMNTIPQRRNDQKSQDI
jgi:hypothetical protein